MPNASRKGSRRPESGPKGGQDVGPGSPDEVLDSDDYASDIKGDNKLQGHEQEHVRNQRQTQPHSKKTTEGVVESFERMDPRARGGEHD